MIYDISKQTGTIPIGRVGENQYRSVEFDLSSWLLEYPEGNISAVFIRPDCSAYPVSLFVSGMIATWHISNTDVAYAGIGELQLTMRLGEMIAKSAIFKTKAEKSLDSDVIPPEDAKDWLKELIGASDKANEAAQRANKAAERAEQVGGGALNLPFVTDSDNGKFLGVVEGKWAATELPKYDGTYVITPSADNEQVLETAQKYVDSDIKVSKIPYFEMDNEAGGTTIYIGSDDELITE